jgi:DNA-binding MltR family transcriptional regulator
MPEIANNSSANAQLHWLMEDGESHEDLLEISSTVPARAAAITAMSVLDNRLTKAIKSRLQKNERALKRVFSAYGPLSSLSGKIDFAALLGLFGEDSRQDLHKMREIRNLFAHSHKKISFDTKEIKAACAQIGLPDRFKNTDNPFTTSTAPLDEAYLEDPRKRFFRACQIANNLLIVAADNPKEKVPEAVF